MKNADICQHRWCRFPYRWIISKPGESWQARYCSFHVDRYRSDLRYTVQRREDS